MRHLHVLTAILFIFGLSACGGGGGGSPPPATYSISGVVDGDTSQGVTITLTVGAQPTVTTSAVDGSYHFSGLINANYGIIPSKAGYIFVPGGAAVPVSGASVSNINFMATASTASTYTLSGTVRGQYCRMC